MLRIVFMGTPEFAVPTLSEILAAGHDVLAVYSQPPRPAGRGMQLTPSPVQSFATASGLTVLTPSSLKSSEAQETFRRHAAEVAVVVAYGLLLPKPILDAPRHGCLNLHGSKLPRWRGAAPMQRAIMAGDTETAVMVMHMEEGLDTGPICLSEQIPIGPDLHAGALHDIMAMRGASLMVRALAALERGSLMTTPQPAEGITYAKKIDKAETRIDFRRPARDVHNHIRGLSPHPGAWFSLGEAKSAERIKVLASTPVPGSGAPGTVIDAAGVIACGDGAIRLLEVQRAGKRPMSMNEFLRGRSLKLGEPVNTV
ncbi:MAG: methionyl-tRNA formyltransferase [Hyphomicrobiaceae bacterium]